MKDYISTRITMTDVASNLTIARQYSCEIKDVDLWFQNHKDSYHISCVRKENTYKGMQLWVNPQSGNQWCSLLILSKGCSFSIPLCFWKTEGSYGFAIEYLLPPKNKTEQHKRILLVFTSHCVLRYKMRLGLDVTGTELLFSLMPAILCMVHHTFERDRRKVSELITDKGVFRLDTHLGNALPQQKFTSTYFVGRIRTFLSWNDLPLGEKVTLQNYYTSIRHPQLIKDKIYE